MTEEVDTLQALKEKGFERGRELGIAIINDNWDRQVYVMQRHSREKNISKEKVGVDGMVAYNSGFTAGLMGIHEDAEVEEKVKEDLKKKVSTWVSTLRERTSKAKKAGVEIGAKMMQFVTKSNWMDTHKLIEVIEEDLEKYLGLEGYEYKVGFNESVQSAVPAMEGDIITKLRELRMIGAPIQVPEKEGQ